MSSLSSLYTRVYDRGESQKAGNKQIKRIKLKGGSGLIIKVLKEMSLSLSEEFGSLDLKLPLGAHLALNL